MPDFLTVENARAMIPEAVRAFPVPVGRRVVFCPDQDAPGSPAAAALEAACIDQLARGVDLWIADAPEAEGSKRDLNDTLQRAGSEAVAKAVNILVKDGGCLVKFTPRDDRGRSIQAPHFTGGHIAVFTRRSVNTRSIATSNVLYHLPIVVLRELRWKKHKMSY